jgi:hypothetical protein
MGALVEPNTASMPLPIQTETDQQEGSSGDQPQHGRHSAPPLPDGA